MKPLCPSDISPARGDALFAYLYLDYEDGADLLFVGLVY
jgi:hypothetical protein